MQEIVVTQDVLRASVHRSSPPTCVANDTAHEMIQVGWNNGGISVYRPVVNEELAEILHWTSFPAHSSPVYQIFGTYGVGIYSVSSKRFAIHSHGGVELFRLSSNDLRTDSAARSSSSSKVEPSVDEFRSFAFINPNRAILGTQSGRVSEADLQYGRLLTSNVGATEAVSNEILKIRTTDKGQSLLGLQSGAVKVWDARSKRFTGNLSATTGGKIIDMDVSGDYLVTCGMSNKGSREPFLRIFDVRTNKQLNPVQFQAPSSIRFVPEPYLAGLSSSTLLMASTTGNLQKMDIRNGGGIPDSYAKVQSGSGGSIEGLAVSYTGRSFSLVDSNGFIHFWSTNIATGWDICDPEILQNQPYPELEHPHNDLTPTSLAHPSSFSADQSCASYPTPFVQPLSRLSDMPPELDNRVLRNSKAMVKLNPKLLEKISQRDYIGYITNTDNLNGLTLLYGKQQHHLAYIDADPRESRHSTKSRTTDGSGSEEELSENEIGEENSEIEKIRKDAKMIKTKYSRPEASSPQQRLSEIDFSEYNLTQFAGLEVDYDPNAYVNAPLQALYFIPEFRERVLALAFSNKPVCIPTETSILFRLLDMARRLPSTDKACQARNFHRAFRLSPDALALGLLEQSKIANDRRAGSFVRFLLTQFIAGGSDAKTIVDELFSVHLSVQDTREVGKKKTVTNREMSSAVIDVVDEESKDRFEKVLASSLCQEKKHRSWDDEAKTYANVTTVKRPLSMPPYLVLNCADLFKRHEPLGTHYFCESFAYDIEKSQVKEMRNTTEPPPGGCEIYDVVAVVSRVTDIDRFQSALKGHLKKEGLSKKLDTLFKVPDEEKHSLDGHLILHVKLQDHYDQVEDGNLGRITRPGSWLLFNDVIVAQSNSSQAFDFSSIFRVPAVVIYKKRGVTLPKAPSRFQVQPEVFETANLPSLTKKRPNVVMNMFGIPNVKAGDIVALDCEFVALSNDVYEIKPDGTRVVISPSRPALARVSCMTTDERLIMDDYVQAGPEPIVDYLTRFSGIVPGDLDQTSTSKPLYPHRVVYSKLLYLVETGCVFVGHGLRNDFKVVNIVVPPEQIRDTSLLFWQRGQRTLSLRYLSSMLLQENIQDRVHSSVQDARATLKLYHLYLELAKANKVEETITRLYLEGPTRNWT